jgi:hypothetical protein
MVDVALSGLVAERRRQSVFGIVGLLRLGQHQRQRLSNVFMYVARYRRSWQSTRLMSAARPSRRRVVLMLHFGDRRPLLVVELEVHIGDSIANVTAR